MQSDKTIPPFKKKLDQKKSKHWPPPHVAMKSLGMGTKVILDEKNTRLKILHVAQSCNYKTSTTVDILWEPYRVDVSKMEEQQWTNIISNEKCPVVDA